MRVVALPVSVLPSSDLAAEDDDNNGGSSTGGFCGTGLRAAAGDPRGTTTCGLCFLCSGEDDGGGNKGMDEAV